MHSSDRASSSIYAGDVLSEPSLKWKEEERAKSECAGARRRGEGVKGVD